MGKPLTGKVAVVTGSTQGLGAAIATLFVKEGAKVVITGLSAKDGKARREELGQERGLRADRPGARRGLPAADSRCPRALRQDRHPGQQRRRRHARDGRRRDARRSSTDLRAQPACATPAGAPCHRVAAARQRGVIINIGSINAFMGEPSLLVYAASKAALQTASRNLANFLKFDRVRVYCLNIGWMDTEGERAMMTQLGHPRDFIERTGQDMAARAHPEARGESRRWRSSSPPRRARRSAARSSSSNSSRPARSARRRKPV